VPVALADRHPVVAPGDLIAQLQPPPRFAGVRFDTFVPDPAHPSQAAAVAAAEAFAQRPKIAEPARFWRRRAAAPEQRPGLYFDGGFGVGKTHLLASLWHASPGAKVFGTFVEYTHLVGALGFSVAAGELARHDLVCIDEFELDDPGDTVLISTLVQRLVDGGARIAATSNTLPDRLGEGRFAADDFLREIQGLSGSFDVLRIDGEDYRHRGLPAAAPPLSDDAVVTSARAAEETWGSGRVSLDSFPTLQRHLATVHPSGYGRLVDGLAAVHVLRLRPLTDQADALRLVVLVDRLYDRDIPVLASGVPVDAVFDAAMLSGGYRKKYYRAISRLVALTREGAGLVARGTG
jgi:cell division protein ZapE